jgi:nucleoside-diphosphate-sugar epimerase
MTKALIGYTGFVGGTLLRQTSFDALYRSTDIRDIRGRSFDLVVCAGAPAAKWLANKEPEKDLANLEDLMASLKEITAGNFILISTVDVYRNPFAVDEDSPIDPALLDPYGRHRFYLEEFVRDRFKNSMIVRLPGLFGQGLKKNFLFDLLHNNCLDWTDRYSVYQFYEMDNLWVDLHRI